MKFNEWQEKVKKLQEQLGVNTLTDVSETIGIHDPKHDHVITINLGKKFFVEVNDSELDIRYLRPVYTGNKETFDDLLQVLTERTREVSELNDGFMTGIVHEAIPGAVMSRIKGEHEDSSNEALLEKLIGQKFEELNTMLGKAVLPFRELIFDFEPIAEEAMCLSRESWKKDGNYVLTVCGCAFDARLTFSSGRLTLSTDFEMRLRFLANFQTIKARIAKFIELLKPLQALAEK